MERMIIILLSCCHFTIIILLLLINFNEGILLVFSTNGFKSLALAFCKIFTLVLRDERNSRNVVWGNAADWLFNIIFSVNLLT